MPIRQSEEDTPQSSLAQQNGPQINQEMEQELQRLSKEETENLVKSFKEHFDECTKACKKPNILVAGITGAGKSTLVNAVFGSEVAQSGVGKPITDKFMKYEPKTKPIVIYDSKGLEYDNEEEFIKDTGRFFTELRNKPDVADHIHAIWYVINPGRGRIDPFELTLVKEVFNPTPVIFVLNKADLADSDSIKKMKEVIENENIPNNKGIHTCVSNRSTWTQSWCPKCLANDIFYDEETRELSCVECNYEVILSETFGMEDLIKHTCDLLPELAKDAFMYSQQASLTEKDRRAKQITKDMMKGLKLDAQGKFINRVAQLCAKLFVIWGWPLTADKFKESLSEMQTHYLKTLKFQERMAMFMIDKFLGSRLSRGFVGIIGLTMNRGMKNLNQTLIASCDNPDDLSPENVEGFMQDSDVTEELIQCFFETALFESVDKALDKYWDISHDELMLIHQHLKSTRFGESEDDMERFTRLIQEASENNNENDPEMEEAKLIMQSGDMEDENADDSKKEDEEHDDLD